MHAVLALEISVGKIALDTYCHALDASLVAFYHVLDGGLVAMLLAPAQVHAHEHRRPVLALGTTSTRVDLHDGAELVLLTAQHVAQLEFLNLVESVGVEGIEFVLGEHAFLDEVEAHFHFTHGSFHLGALLNPHLDGLDFAHLRFGFLLVTPEVGHMSAQLLFF